MKNRYLISVLHLLLLSAGISGTSGSYQVQEKQELKNKTVTCTLTYTFPEKIIKETEDNPIHQRITITREYAENGVPNLGLPQKDKIILKHIDTDEEAESLLELLEASKNFLEQYDSHLYKGAGGGKEATSIKSTWDGRSYSDYFKKAIIFYE